MAQMFKQKPIDGNSIVANIQKRRKQPGQFGRMHNLTTGETVTRQSPNAPEMEPSTYNQEYSKIPSPQERDTSSDNDLMEADEGFRQFSQAYEYDTGITPTYDQYEEYMAADNAEGEVAESELEDAKIDYLNTMGSLSNFMEDRGITIDDLIAKLPEDLADNMDVEDLVAKVKDPRKMESFDDLTSVGMAIDMFADFLNLDTNKFFTTGEAIECGEECMQGREDDKAAYEQMIIEEDTPLSYEDRLASLEQ